VVAVLATAGLVLVACTSTSAGTGRPQTVVGTNVTTSPAATPKATPSGATSGATSATTSGTTSGTLSGTDTRPPGEFTFSFAGDVNFEELTKNRLSSPSTIFAEAQPGLTAADLTMVNLETAITTGGDKQVKSYNFRAPPVALTALRVSGVDVATMANNHAADYGASGLADTLAAITASKLPVVGIGANSASAYAPWVTTVRGVKIAVFAATAVQDETLAHFTAGPSSAGVASAYSGLLLNGVKRAKAAGDIVIVYLHWGTEYTTCADSTQHTLANQLAAAGATAVIGTHAHMLQGAGWRPDGVYVAFGLGNYLWWRQYFNGQDDNGVLTLTFSAADGGKVIANKFAPSRLDPRGVPVPATGATLARIKAEWATATACGGLSTKPPA
jgi:hypothetical protein